jgi:hypothetical protein
MQILLSGCPQAYTLWFYSVQLSRALFSLDAGFMQLLPAFAAGIQNASHRD